MAREKGDVECTWKLSNLRASLSGPEWTGRAIDCFVEGIFFDTKERSFKTEVSRNTKEPRFNYCTMFRCVLKPDIVQKKYLRLYLKDAAASGAEIGRVHVTVQLLLTGPVNHSLSLVKVSDDGQTAHKVGMIHFACEVDEIELCSVVLNDVVLPTEAAHPALQNGKGLLMKIEHTNRPDNASGWDTKYRIKQTSVTEKGKQGKNGPLWKEMEPIVFECSLRELMKQSVQLSFLDRARPDAAPLAKGELPLRIFLVAVRGQTRQQTTVDAYLKDGKGVEIAKLSATIEFFRLPHYAQLTGGLHQDGGVEGGAPLFPGVPAPLVEMNHPDMYITVNAKSPRLGKSDKTTKIPALGSSPPPAGRSALTDSAPEFVEQGTLSPRKEKEKEIPDSPLSPRSRDLKAAKKREKEEREREEKERKEKEKADKERREREKQAEKERVEREAKEAKAAKAGLSRSKTATALRSASPPQVPEPTKPEERRTKSGSLILSKSTPPPTRVEASSPPPQLPPPEAYVPTTAPLAAVASVPTPTAAAVAAPEGATLSRSGKSWSRLVDPSPSIVSAPRTGIYGAPSPSYDSNGMPLDRGWEFVMMALEAAFPPGHAFDLESSLRGNDSDETRGRAPTDPALAILQREKTPPVVKPSIAPGPAPPQPQSPASSPAPRPSRPSGRATVGAAPNTLGRLPSHTSSFAPSQYSAPPPHDPTAAAQLPLGWEEKTDSQGRKYYVDHVTKTTSWTAPRATTSLPPGWEKRRDAQGRTYYVDHVNRKTQWAPPPGAQEP